MIELLAFQLGAKVYEWSEKVRSTMVVPAGGSPTEPSLEYRPISHQALPLLAEPPSIEAVV